MSKTYNIQVLEPHDQELCWNNYEELTKEAAERIIASCFNTQMSIVDVEIYDNEDNKVKYKIKVECEIDTGEKMYDIPPVDSEKEKMVDAIVKRYYDKQPKTILKKAKTIPMGNASDFSDFIHTRADEIKEEQRVSKRGLPKPMTEGNEKRGGNNGPPKGPKPFNPPPGRNPRK